MVQVQLKVQTDWCSSSIGRARRADSSFLFLLFSPYRQTSCPATLGRVIFFTLPHDSHADSQTDTANGNI